MLKIHYHQRQPNDNGDSNLLTKSHYSYRRYNITIDESPGMWMFRTKKYILICKYFSYNFFSLHNLTNFAYPQHDGEQDEPDAHQTEEGYLGEFGDVPVEAQGHANENRGYQNCNFSFGENIIWSYISQTYYHLRDRVANDHIVRNHC